MVAQAVRLDMAHESLVVAAAIRIPSASGVFKSVVSRLVNDHTKYNQQAAKVLHGKATFDGGLYSEPLMHLHVYNAWKHLHETTARAQSKFCEEYGIVRARMISF